jgi:hypothetical protein
MSDRTDLSVLEQRLRRALGLGPVVVGLAVACAPATPVGDEAAPEVVDAVADPAADPAAPVDGSSAPQAGLPATQVVDEATFDPDDLEGVPVLEPVLAGLRASLDDRLTDIDLRSTFRLRGPAEVPADHVSYLMLEAAPATTTVSVRVLGAPEAEGDEPVELATSSTLTNLAGESLMRFVVPADASGSVDVEITVERPNGEALVNVYSFQVTEALTIAPQLTLLHPGMGADELIADNRYRACVPAEAGVCTATADFHQWQSAEVASYAIDESIGADLDVMACGLDYEVHPADGADGSCCYMISTGQVGGAAANCDRPEDEPANNGGGGGWGWYEGRPFTTADGPREASVRRGGDWQVGDAFAAPLDDALRAEVVASWSATALAEHASIASFSRFQLELLALGAPADLLARAAAAIADEARHAEHAFRVASRFAGQAIEPGPLSIDGALDRSTDVVAVLTGAIHEGCINETIAAMGVQRLADQVADPSLAADLRAIADDEARHAELSWAFVRWLLSERPEFVPVAREAFASFPLPEAPEADDDPRLAAWGVMGAKAQHQVATEVLQRVIEPCAEALFSTC